MARPRVDLPEAFDYSTEASVRISNINYGMHLGADQVLPLALETQMRFLAHLGYGMLDVAGGTIIMTDSVIVYKAQAAYGDRLRIELAVAGFTDYGFDFVYRMTNKDTGVEVARVKTGILFYDYDNLKRQPVPEAFRARFADR